MNIEYVVSAIECLIDAKFNGTPHGVRLAQKELNKALRTVETDNFIPYAAKVNFEEDLPKMRYVTFLYNKGDSHPTRRMIQVDKDEYGVISGIDVDKDEYRTFLKNKIIGNIEKIV